jgi:hypothetical protein
MGCYGMMIMKIAVSDGNYGIIDGGIQHSSQ